MTPEGQIKSDICKLLNKLGIEHYRMQVGRIGKGRYSFGVKKGTADLLVFHRRQTLWIETKTKGGKMSKEQVEFRDERTNLGHDHLVAESVDDVLNWINTRGRENGD